MATKIIQTPRRIQSPGVQITETDLSRIPRGSGGARRLAAMVTGFSPQGPTDQVVRINNMSQFSTIFGLPETAAERYLYYTVEQLTGSSSDIFVTRIPYGERGGEEDPQNYYSALAFPVLPHGTSYTDAEAFYVLPPKSVKLSEQEYETYVKEGNLNWNNSFVNSVSTISNKSFTLDRGIASALFLDVVKDLRVTDVDYVNSHFPYSENTALFDTYTNATKLFTFTQQNSGFFASVSAGDVLKGYKTNVQDANNEFSIVVANRDTISGNISAASVNGLTTDIAPTINASFVYNFNNVNLYTGPVFLPNQSYISRPLSSFNIQQYFNQRLQDYVDNLAVNHPDVIAAPHKLDSSKVGHAPIAWAKVNTNINSISSWVNFVSSKFDNLNDLTISYDLYFHTASSLNSLSIDSKDQLTNASIILINSDKLVSNDLFEGYYIALADNSDDTPYTDFKAVTAIFAVNSASNAMQNFYQIPEDRLNFTLTESYSSVRFDSLSEKIARFPNYEISDDTFNDCLKLFVYRLNTSPYLKDTITLDYSNVEAYIGSLYSKRKQNNPNGGRLISFNIENRIQNNFNSRIEFVVNPNISETGSWIDSYGKPLKKVRVSDGAKAVWSYSSYSPITVDSKNKNIGDIELKLDRVFQTYELTENESRFVDIICEGGLSTIAVGTSALKVQNIQYLENSDLNHFDDTRPVDISALKVVPKNWTAYYQEPEVVRDSYSRIQRMFRNFANNKKNHVFISDPLRYIFVKGRNYKHSDSRTFNFTDDILRPLNVTYATVGRTTYMATYANWLRRYDSNSDEFVWLPPSGFVGRSILNTMRRAPWLAPAGFNNGRLTGVVDLALNPNQRQRDLLYRQSYNPIVNFPREGMVIYGQKTYINYQSAFDRLNVRNLFLWLEKSTTTILNRFVFEPNTISLRNRVVLRLTPLFERAKISEGIYDYRIVCDERNNTPDTIDRNELRVAIYIQPVRTAEFILVDFVATRTGVDLDALIGQ